MLQSAPCGVFKRRRAPAEAASVGGRPLPPTPPNAGGSASCSSEPASAARCYRALSEGLASNKALTRAVVCGEKSSVEKPAADEHRSRTSMEHPAEILSYGTRVPGEPGWQQVRSTGPETARGPVKKF